MKSPYEITKQFVSQLQAQINQRPVQKSSYVSTSVENRSIEGLHHHSIIDVFFALYDQRFVPAVYLAVTNSSNFLFVFENSTYNCNLCVSQNDYETFIGEAYAITILRQDNQHEIFRS